MVQSLPGFLNLCLNVCSPSQVLWDVYTEVLEATHPLHMGPTDHKRSVGPLLSLPEVHDQLFSFAHVQRETVVLAPWCESLHLIQVCGLIIVVNEAQNHSIICKFNNRSGAVRGHAVVGVERVEQGAQDTALRTRPVIPSGPAAFLTFTLLSSLRTSSSDRVNTWSLLCLLLPDALHGRVVPPPLHSKRP